jgi:hypothetical protein
MRHLRFYKESDQWFEDKWFVELPDWTGDKADLEMVSGADTMLEIMAEGERNFIVALSDTYFENSDEIKFIRMADDIGNGAYYFMEKYKGIKLDLNIWLCDVTIFAFGKFPEKIYIAKPM